MIVGCQLEQFLKYFYKTFRFYRYVQLQLNTTTSGLFSICRSTYTLGCLYLLLNLSIHRRKF